MILPVDTTIPYYMIYATLSIIIGVIIVFYRDTILVKNRSEIDYKGLNVKFGTVILSITCAFTAIYLVNQTRLNGMKEEAVTEINKSIEADKTFLAELQSSYEKAEESYGRNDNKYYKENLRGRREIMNNVKVTISDKERNIDFIQKGKLLVVGDKVIANNGMLINW